jgi:hypothetical protein
MGETYPAFPTVHQVINDRIKEVVQLISRWFRRSRNDSGQVHIFWFVPDIKGEVQARAGDYPSGSRCISLKIAFNVEEINVERESELTLAASIDK